MLAQLKRNAFGQAETVHHLEHDLQREQLALEGSKKRIEDINHKLRDAKRRLEQLEHDVRQAEDELRRKTANQRRE